MIDPVIFSFKLFGGIVLTLRWYGVLVMLGALVGAWVAERGIRQRGENGDVVWDALVLVLPVGIIGARLWYVLNATIGGSRYYLDDPKRILYITEGGLHIFGGFLFGAIALLLYLRQKKMDVWLFLDSIAPAALIGQAVARPANFINQELYGPPTKLPWGIPIDASHRLAAFSDLNLYPVDTTRFHPTFAYEMLWNFAMAGILLWLWRRYDKQLKPGTLFGGWLVAAGFGRVWLELFFRPDQPKIPGTIISYSAIVAALMGVTGVILLLVRYGRLQLSFAEGWEEAYQVTMPEKKARARKTSTVSVEAEADAPVKQRKPATKKTSPRSKAKPASAKK